MALAHCIQLLLFELFQVLGSVGVWRIDQASSQSMGNKLQRRDPIRITKVAVNVEKRLAERGYHLNQLCVLDRQLYCSVNIRGVSSQVQSGAFLWYLLSPTSEHLDLLAGDMVQSSDNNKNNDNNTAVFQCFKSNKDGTMEVIPQLSSSSRKDDPLTQQQILLCYNDIELCVGNENVWSVMNHKDRSRVEMTMSSSMEMMNSKRGLIPGNYRVDFYHSQIPLGDQKFYNLNKILPKATQSAHFQVL